MNWFRLMLSPNHGWQAIATSQGSWVLTLGALLVLALLPASAWYYGVTEVGWTIGGSSALKMTPESASIIIGLFYAAMVLGILFIAGSIQWMSVTYGSTSTPLNALRLCVYTASPLFIAGLTGFVPLLWLDLIIGIAAACYAVVLLYSGIPVLLRIPKERGYLFASAIAAVCLVLLIALMGITVTAWEWGAMPVFTD